MSARLRTLWLLLGSLLLGACRGGINAGGETATSNGGIAWIAMATMLIVTGVILYIITGGDA